LLLKQFQKQICLHNKGIQNHVSLIKEPHSSITLITLANDQRNGIYAPKKSIISSYLGYEVFGFHFMGLLPILVHFQQQDLSTATSKEMSP